MVQPLELVAHNTLEGGAEQASADVALADASNEQINVVHVIIDHLESLHNLIGDEVHQIVKVWHPAQPAELSEAVVPPSLDVQGGQVHVEALFPALEQVVGQPVRGYVVKLLAWLCGQAHQELVQASSLVH